MEVSNNIFSTLSAQEQQFLIIQVFLGIYALLAVVLVFYMVKSMKTAWSLREHYANTLRQQWSKRVVYKGKLVRWWKGKRMNKKIKQRFMLEGIEDSIESWLADQLVAGTITADDARLMRKRIGETSPLKGLLSRNTLQHRADLKRKLEENKHRREYRAELLKKKQERLSKRQAAAKQGDLQAFFSL